jgi:formate dehydrogenase major subunit
MKRETVKFQLNDRDVTALAGETIWSVAQREGIAIAHLCHTPGLRPEGNCRACMVEVEGERVLAASCCRNATDGMKVQTHSARATKARSLVLELLMSDAGQTTDALTKSSEISYWANKENAKLNRLPMRETRALQSAPDASHPAIHVDLDAFSARGACAHVARSKTTT